MNAQSAQILLDRVVRALRGLGLTVTLDDQVPTVESGPPVTWISVSRERCRLTYSVAVKRRVTYATVGAVLTQLRSPRDAGQPRPLLITDHVAPPVAESLRRHEQHFADAAGNAYLEGDTCLVSVSGRKLREKQAAVRSSREFTVTRLKVLFALICDPELAASPYRTIAAAAAVALGAMPTVIADLQQEGLLHVVARQRRLAASRRLLDDWAHAYALGLRGKTLIGRYRAQNFADWRDWPLVAAPLRWGGEPAAARCGCDLVPGTLTLYGDKLPARLIDAEQISVAGPLDYERLVELRKPFWGQSLRVAEPSEVVPAALVYADLLATGSARCIAAAQAIYGGELARSFPVA